MAVNQGWVPLTVAEYEARAREKLPKQIWDYFISGCDDGAAVTRSREVFNKLVIRPRMLRGVSHIDTTVKMFGRTYKIPVGIAPSAMHCLAGGDGELDTARAASGRGTAMCLSTNSTHSLEDVMAASRESPDPADLWFQLYVLQNREHTAKMIKRAEAAGYTAIVLTIDTPLLGNRLNERRNPIVLPAHLSLPNLQPRGPDLRGKPSANAEVLRAPNRGALAAIKLAPHFAGRYHDDTLTWSGTIPWVRSQCGPHLRLILKGILTAEDAELAVQHGADAVWVSGHGGRQLESACAPLEALPEVVAAVRGRVPIIVDGGFMRGADVFKALALGADFVMVGRPALWGLACAGRTGVEGVLDVLELELYRTMALAGARTVGEIDTGLVGVERRDGFGIAKL